VILDERVDALHGELGLIRFDRLEHGGKPQLRTRLERLRARGEGEQAAREEAPRHQLPERSCWICQRPSVFVMISVLLLVFLRTSER